MHLSRASNQRIIGCSNLGGYNRGVTLLVGRGGPSSAVNSNPWTGSTPMRTATSWLPFMILAAATIQLMPRPLPEDIVRMVVHHLELGNGARVAPSWRSWRWMVDCSGDRIAWI